MGFTIELDVYGNPLQCSCLENPRDGVGQSRTRLKRLSSSSSSSGIFLPTHSLIGEGNGNPLHYSCLEIPWTEEPGGLQSVGSRRVGHDWATSISLFTFHFHALEKEMETHSSIHAWRIPRTAELGGLPTMGSHRVRHDWSDLAAAV